MPIVLKRPPHPDVIELKDDLDRIRSALADAGYSASDDDLLWAWEQYSDQRWCATWFSVDHSSADEIARGVLSVLVADRTTTGP